MGSFWVFAHLNKSNDFRTALQIQRLHSYDCPSLHSAARSFPMPQQAQLPSPSDFVILAPVIPVSQ